MSPERDTGHDTEDTTPETPMVGEALDEAEEQTPMLGPDPPRIPESVGTPMVGGEPQPAEDTQKETAAGEAEAD